MQSNSAAKNYIDGFQEAASAAQSQQQKDDEEDVSAGKYGSYGLIQSGEVKDIKFAELKDINESMHGQDVIIFAFQNFYWNFRFGFVAEFMQFARRARPASLCFDLESTHFRLVLLSAKIPT